MTMQSEIDALSALCHQVGQQAELRDVTRMSWVQAQLTQAALSGLVDALRGCAVMPPDVLNRHIEAGYRRQRESLLAAGSSILLPSSGKPT